MPFSAEDLSKPISEELPCGEDLEYDPAFQEMETLMQSTPEQEVGDTIVAAVPPDWKGVVRQTKDLLGRTRDMRVFVNAAIAGLNQDGLGEFKEVLTALTACMEQHWESIHPLLDPDDDNDPMMRMNILQNLSHYDNVRKGLERSPLVSIKGLGSFSFHDIQVAEGREEADPDVDAPDTALIQGAFSQADPSQLRELGEAVTGSIEQLQQLLDVWAHKTGNYEAPELAPTITTLKNMLQTISAYSPTIAEAVSDEQPEAAGGDGAVAAAVSGAINSRSDVIKAIDRICEYYQANEPSSPIPILLRRAQRLVAKSFFEILEDVAPDGLAKARELGGAAQGD